MLLADRETWELALMLREKRGETALEDALERAKVAADAGDEGRFQMWQEIVKVLQEMERPRQGDDPLN